MALFAHAGVRLHFVVSVVAVCTVATHTHTHTKTRRMRVIMEPRLIALECMLLSQVHKCENDTVLCESVPEKLQSIA